MTTKEIKKTEDQLPASYYEEMENFAGAGAEEIGAEEVAIPRFRILQANSPETIKKNEKYIEGAEGGMIYSEVLRKVIDGEKGVLFCVVKFKRTVVEWTPRNDKGEGGEFVADHGSNFSILNTKNLDDRGRPLSEGGNELSDTYNFYGFLFEKDSVDYEPCIISMSRTQIKIGKRMNTDIRRAVLNLPDGRKINPASWFNIFDMQTEYIPKGSNSYFNWKMDSNTPMPQAFPDDYQRLNSECASFLESLNAGDIKEEAYENTSHGETGKANDEDNPM